MIIMTMVMGIRTITTIMTMSIMGTTTITMRMAMTIITMSMITTTTGIMGIITTPMRSRKKIV